MSGSGSELIKFRLSSHAKHRISRHAERHQKSVAAFMRDLTAQAIMGRSMDESIRADMALVRQLANTVLAHAQALGEDHPLSAALREVGTRMRDTAARHLRAAQ